MKYYTLEEIYNRFGGNPNPDKAIVETNTPGKFRLVEIVDSWDSLSSDGVVKTYFVDARENIYRLIPDPKGQYLPFSILRED